ncbi:PLP-dependent aminotransferase family protein [Roseateles sp. DAIF2]|uniref:MocR-like pyridoxine biosynthesis transcription factor PdxR n=1 Tax=Roseateles sp. DAIF2 TaxID=2714952 RepID=UPI0018A24F5B|nr:PLP-dependent aminotransferase family protein [Roseateles sp. DAIF2]QPF71737.1 PLP-dependent aminotransferase family protein [Roseateles sp. DAIF2]
MELHLVVDPGQADLVGQLCRQIRGLIRGGHLAAGERLPPTRLLAAQLGLSRKTVAEAYARLAYERLLEGRPGSGTFVARAAPPPAEPRPSLASESGADARIARWRALTLPLRHPAPQGGARYEYIGGAPEPRLFPHEAWRRCMQHGLRQDAARSRGQYGPAEGLPELREAIARHLAFARGVRAEASEVLVTNGAQQALDLLARVLVEPGCTVAVEEPGYLQARLLLQAQGARVVGVPVDAEGLIVERIPAEARLIYVTPAHQFPLGMPMSPARRRALLAHAQRHGAILVEDDYDSEFRYEGRPTDSLQGLDEQGRVAFVGSFSKTLSPSLRLGYLVAPRPLIEAVANAKHLADWHSPLPAQWALARFIAEGELRKHIGRCHQAYARRRALLLEQLAGPLAPWFEAVPIEAGFHMAALACRPLDMAALLSLARRVEVGLYPLDVFYAEGAPRQGLVLGFGAIEALDIPPSLERVREVLLQLDG